MHLYVVIYIHICGIVIYVCVCEYAYLSDMFIMCVCMWLSMYTERNDDNTFNLHLKY